MRKKPSATPEEEVNARVEAAVKRKRSQRPFPACGFEEALDFAKELFNYGSGKAVRRLSFFDHLQNPQRVAQAGN